MQSEDELIIIDNNSPQKNELDYFVKNDLNLKNPNIYFYMLTENHGFGKAINFAVSKSKNEFLCLVNPDCRVKNKGFTDWALYHKNKTNFSVLAPKIYYPDNTPQPNLGGFSNPLTFVLQFLKVGTLIRKFKLFKLFVNLLNLSKFILPSDIKNYLINFNNKNEKEVNADWVSGAFMIVVKNDFLSINGFDDNFFMYCEDEDLCKRLKALNKVILWAPDFAVTHTVGATDNILTNHLSRAQKERYFSKLYFIQKWYGSLYFYLFKVFYFFGFIIIGIFNLFIFHFTKAKSLFQFAFKILLFHYKPIIKKPIKSILL
jgi:hypothetical protein